MHHWIGGTKRGNLTPEEQTIDQKRSRSEQSSCACIIQCTDDDTELVRPKDESWSTLVRGEQLLLVKHLDVAETLNEGEIPTFTITENVIACLPWKSSWKQFQSNKLNWRPTAAKRTSIRQSPTTSTTYEHVCIFCEKKYRKGTRNWEPLEQCRDLRADHSIRKSAMAKKDSRILAIGNSWSLLPQDMLQGLY